MRRHVNELSPIVSSTAVRSFGPRRLDRPIATRALAAFLRIVNERPLHAHVAKHNVASIRVLEKCGFKLEGEESVEFDGKDIAELVLILR